MAEGGEDPKRENLQKVKKKKIQKAHQRNKKKDKDQDRDLVKRRRVLENLEKC